MNQPPAAPIFIMYEMQLQQARNGVGPHLLSSVMNLTNHFLNSCFPRASVYTEAFLSADVPSSGGGDDEDHISALPDAILRNVISRLLAKDAARTAAFSSRWRPLWRSVPLVLFDFHLLRGNGDSDYGCVSREALSSIIAAAVTRVLEAHPGPFRDVAISWVVMDERRDELARWLLLLAINNVEKLVLVNCPLPFDVPLPSTIFSLASVRRLHLGIWRFPDTTALPRGAAFPHVVELGLCYVAMEDEDLDFILARSPALESLVIYTSQKDVNLRIISSSLRCVQLCLCVVGNLAVVDAPCLERLFLWEAIRDGTKIKFGDDPNLRIVGFLMPGLDVLEVGDTVIKVGTKARSNTIVPSVRILALIVRFDIRDEAMMLPSFLRCFPNVEILHIESAESYKPICNLKHKFWKDTGCIECVQLHIKEIVFYGYRGGRNELAFLKVILGKAQVLQKIEIAFAYDTKEDVSTELADCLSSVKKASENCSVVFSDLCSLRAYPSWSCEVPSDFSVTDPLVNIYRLSMAS